MNAQQYKERIELLEKQKDIEVTSGILGDYEKNVVLTTANLAKLMPHIPVESHEAFCRKNFYYKELSSIQVQYLNILQNAKITGNFDYIIKEQTPKIFCTFHLGSYRMINSFLFFQNIDFEIVISKRTLKDQIEGYSKINQEINKVNNTNKQLQFIEAENPSSMLSMIKALKKGKSLLFYIDGNTGVGGVGRTDEKMLTVNFLSSTIFARKGIAFLAHKCNIPIVNCFSYIEGERDIVTMQFNDPIYPDEGAKDINEFCQETTQRIYDEFSAVLKKYPEQWEAWMYIHRYMDTNSFKDTEDVPMFDQNTTFIYNKKRFKDFTHSNQKYLFDTVTYNTYPVNNDFANILKNTPYFNTENKIITEDIFELLVNKKILTPKTI